MTEDGIKGGCGRTDDDLVQSGKAALVVWVVLTIMGVALWLNV